MADLEQALLAAEHVGCLRPVTGYLQGPDPDDTPEPCGTCPLCVVIGERDEARELAKRFMLERNQARAEVDRLQGERDALAEMLADETWWVGGAWGDYGEPVVLARNVAERLGEEYERDRDMRTADYAANYAEAVSAADLAEQERDAARAEVVRLTDGIRGLWETWMDDDASWVEVAGTLDELHTSLDVAGDDGEDG